MDQVEIGLTPPERISLAGDEWAQVRANKATVGDYLDLVTALKIRSETPKCFPSISPALRDVDDQVASTKEERDALAAWIRRNFAPEYARLGRLGRTTRPTSASCARDLLSAARLFAATMRNLLAQARNIADQYLADPCFG